MGLPSTAQHSTSAEGRPAEAAADEPAPAKDVPPHKVSGSWSTGGKIGAGLGVGGVAVAGAILGCHLAGDSDAAVESGLDGGEDAVEATDDAMVDASELVVEAGEDVSDSVL